MSWLILRHNFSFNVDGKSNDGDFDLVARRVTCRLSDTVITITLDFSVAAFTRGHIQPVAAGCTVINKLLLTVFLYGIVNTLSGTEERQLI